MPLGGIKAFFVHVGHFVEHVFEANRIDIADLSVWDAPFWQVSRGKGENVQG